MEQRVKDLEQLNQEFEQENKELNIKNGDLGLELASKEEMEQQLRSQLKAPQADLDKSKKLVVCQERIEG